MNSRAIARMLLIVAGLYDGVLGGAFLFTAPAVFSLFEIPDPNHWGYVHFGAALLVIFGLMFFAAARHPDRNRNLIPYGMLLKIAYVGVVLFHWTQGGVPWIFKPFLVCDVVWFFALAWTYHAVGRSSAADAGGVNGAGRFGTRPGGLPARRTDSPGEVPLTPSARAGTGRRHRCRSATFGSTREARRAGT